MDHQTLIALACMIANKGPLNTESLEAQMSANDKIQVQKIIDSKACLPDNMEKLLSETQQKVDNNEIIEPDTTMPCRDCVEKKLPE